MDSSLVAKIEGNPTYQELKARRSRLGWVLTIAMLVVYYGFILLVAFNKALLATPLGQGVTTYGIPIGLFVIVFTIVITVYYVRRANAEFDALADKVNREVLR